MYILLQNYLYASNFFSSRIANILRLSLPMRSDISNFLILFIISIGKERNLLLVAKAE